MRKSPRRRKCDQLPAPARGTEPRSRSAAEKVSGGSRVVRDAQEETSAMARGSEPADDVLVNNAGRPEGEPARPTRAANTGPARGRTEAAGDTSERQLTERHGRSKGGANDRRARSRRDAQRDGRARPDADNRADETRSARGESTPRPRGRRREGAGRPPTRDTPADDRDGRRAEPGAAGDGRRSRDAAAAAAGAAARWTPRAAGGRPRCRRAGCRRGEMVALAEHQLQSRGRARAADEGSASASSTSCGCWRPT